MSDWSFTSTVLSVAGAVAPKSSIPPNPARASGPIEPMFIAFTGTTIVSLASWVSGQAATID